MSPTEFPHPLLPWVEHMNGGTESDDEGADSVPSPAARQTASVAERLDTNSVRAPSGCLIWLGQVRRKDGYGLISVLGKKQPVHRVAYTEAVGPIPDGMHIDHLCRTRRCIEPGHLEAVTPAVNRERSLNIGMLMSRWSICKAGHAWTPENTYRTARGSRVCIECRKVQHREGRWRRKAAAAASPAEPDQRRHIPTAYLPVEDPANGESCQECGEWWPCPEAWQVVEPRLVVCARIKASVAAHDAVCPGVQEGQR